MRRSSKNIQKGFTLIELMIVIAIIGILAALGLPAYQDYIARAQATEALVSTSGLRVEIAAYYWEKGYYPAVGNHVLISANKLKGKYYDAGGAIVAPDTGIITVGFTRGVNKEKTVVLVPTINRTNRQMITWVCQGTVGKMRLPTSCQ